MRVNQRDSLADFVNEFYVDFCYDYKNFTPLGMSCEGGLEMISEVLADIEHKEYLDKRL